MAAENLLERITVSGEICNGKPVISGLRIAVSTIVEFLLAGTPESEILYQYPDLTHEDLEACKLFAVKMLIGKFTLKDYAA